MAKKQSSAKKPAVKKTTTTAKSKPAVKKPENRVAKEVESIKKDMEEPMESSVKRLHGKSFMESLADGEITESVSNPDLEEVLKDIKPGENYLAWEQELFFEAKCQSVVGISNAGKKVKMKSDEVGVFTMDISSDNPIWGDCVVGKEFLFNVSTKVK